MTPTLTERVARAVVSGAGIDWDSMPNSNFDAGAVVGVMTKLGAMNAAQAAIQATGVEGLVRALEKVSDLDVSPIIGANAGARNGKELIRGKALARQALDAWRGG